VLSVRLPDLSRATSHQNRQSSRRHGAGQRARAGRWRARWSVDNAAQIVHSAGQRRWPAAPVARTERATCAR